MEESPTWKAHSSTCSCEFPCISWKPNYITTFTTLTTCAHPESYEYNPQSNCISCRSVLILFSQLRLDLASGHCRSRLTTKILCAQLLCLTYATCPAHLILLDLMTRTILDEVLITQSSPAPATSSLWGPNIFLSSLFSNTFSFSSWIGTTEFYTYEKQHAKLRFLYLVFAFLHRKWL